MHDWLTIGNFFFGVLTKQDTLEKDLFVQTLLYQGKYFYVFALLHPGTVDGCGLDFGILSLFFFPQCKALHFSLIVNLVPLTGNAALLASIQSTNLPSFILLHVSTSLYFLSL